MKSARRRVDVNLDELDQVLDGARQAPLSEADYDKLKGALHALAAMLVRPRPTEKTSAVLEESAGSETGAGSPPDSDAPPAPGDGRTHGRRTGAKGRKGVWRRADGRDCAPEVDARGPLPGVRQRQRIRAEGAEGARADRGTGAAGGHSLLAGAVALRCLRTSIHSRRAGRSRSGKVR